MNSLLFILEREYSALASFEILMFQEKIKEHHLWQYYTNDVYININININIYIYIYYIYVYVYVYGHFHIFPHTYVRCQTCQKHVVSKCRGLRCVARKHQSGLRNQPRNNVPFPGFENCISNQDFHKTCASNPYVSPLLILKHQGCRIFVGNPCSSISKSPLHISNCGMLKPRSSSNFFRWSPNLSIFSRRFFDIFAPPPAMATLRPPPLEPTDGPSETRRPATRRCDKGRLPSTGIFPRISWDNVDTCWHMLIYVDIHIPSGNLTWLLKMTIEIVDFPIRNGDFP